MAKNKATMVVDATNLYKIVFEGVKSYALQKQNVHAVWGFLKKLRGVLNENLNNHTYQINRTILFWDGPDSGRLREDIYPNYKEKRKRFFNGIDPYYQQQYVVQDLLRLLGIESYTHHFVETDDMIAEYVRQNKEKENILILSNDNDYFQLVDKTVYIYYLNRIQTLNHVYPKNVLINSENFDYYFDYNPKNILLRKIIIGDESDSIIGAKGFSEKSFLNEIPMFIKKPHSREELLQYCYERKKIRTGKRLQILIDFLQDDEKFTLVETLIDLKSDRFITEDCRQDIIALKPLPINLKQFFTEIKGGPIFRQIVTDPDFDGDVKNFTAPFLYTNK
jgi:5'-3' exonuclease